MSDEPLTVQILKDVFDGIEHYYGKEGLGLVAGFASLKNRARESNKLIDELEAQFGPFTSSDSGVESGHATASGSGPLPEPILNGDACSALEPPTRAIETVDRHQELKRAVGVTTGLSETISRTDREGGWNAGRGLVVTPPNGETR